MPSVEGIRVRQDICTANSGRHAAQFQGLTDVPPELERFVNIWNPCTRATSHLGLQDFRGVTGMNHPEAFP
jgi:hypothetical protein